MLYRVKELDSGKITEMFGESEDALRKMFAMMSKEVEITKVEGNLPIFGPPPAKANSPDLDKLNVDNVLNYLDATASKEEPKVVSNIKNPEAYQEPVKPVIPVVEFEDNGVKFKMENGGVYKETWVEVKDLSRYKIEGDKILMLDWVKIK